MQQAIQYEAKRQIELLESSWEGLGKMGRSLTGFRRDRVANLSAVAFINMLLSMKVDVVGRLLLLLLGDVGTTEGEPCEDCLVKAGKVKTPADLC